MDNVTFDITFGSGAVPLLCRTSAKKGDIYELLIDCHEEKIELIHIRTGNRNSLKINTSKYPSPWKYRFCQDGTFLENCFPIIIRIKQVKHTN